MYKIAVVGAGVMGTGVAQKFAQYGNEVVLLDINLDIAEKAKKAISNNIRMYNMFNKDNKIKNIEGVLEKIKCSENYQDLSDVDFVIENVTENIEVKKEVYSKLEKVCKNECIYMVNTSCISITKVGSFTKREDKVIGTHFMNPVPLKKVSEVIKGYHTSGKTINLVKELLESVNINAVIVNDYPGFVSNRISHLLMNEAAYVVQDGVASPKDVDKIFQECFEHKMGPLATADLIGLDTVVNSLDVLYKSYQDPKFRVCPLLRKMVDAGLYGRKSGEGFYKYI